MGTDYNTVCVMRMLYMCVGVCVCKYEYLLWSGIHTGHGVYFSFEVLVLIVSDSVHCFDYYFTLFNTLDFNGILNIHTKIQ